jgi:hypothetical protein
MSRKSKLKVVKPLCSIHLTQVTPCMAQRKCTSKYLSSGVLDLTFSSRIPSAAPEIPVQAPPVPQYQPVYASSGVGMTTKGYAAAEQEAFDPGYIASGGPTIDYQSNHFQPQLKVIGIEAVSIEELVQIAATLTQSTSGIFIGPQPGYHGNIIHIDDFFKA